MKKQVFLIIKAEITTYPPILTILTHILKLNMIPVVVGVFNEETVRNYYIEKGMKYIPTTQYNPKANLFDKLQKQLKYKKEVNRILSEQYREGDYVWIFNLETMMLLDGIVEKYKTILHFFEFVGESFNWKYRILNPSYSMSDTVSHAFKVIHCEYNRAQISMGLYGMDKQPIILPNKPLFSEEIFNDVPDWINKRLFDFDAKIKNRKVILYQGAFNERERRLEEFCEAMDYLSNEYVFVAMGKETPYTVKLKQTYESEKVIFEDYLPAPFHLLITKRAAVGILTYFPLSRNFVDVINPIYCAPNKIFEYAYFSVPMIGNNIPGLYYPFNQFNCGEVVATPLKPSEIANAISAICQNFEKYSQGATELYNSVDISAIINTIFEE